MSAAANTGGPRSLTPSLPRKRAIDDLLPSAGKSTAAESPMTIAKRRLAANRIAQIAFVVLVLIVVLCFSASWFETHWAGRTALEQNPSGSLGKQELLDMRGMPQVGPGLRKEYTMGADPLGRDLFMRVIKGGKVSLTIAFTSAFIAVGLGLLIGTAAGYFKGTLDAVISRAMDVLIAFPMMIFAIALSTALATSDGFLFIQRGSIGLQIMIMGVLGAPVFARIVRSSALSLGEREFVEAAQALGATHKRILFKHIIPHLSTVVITYFGIIVGSMLLTEAGLSFLGIGVLPPTPSWGNIIADGRIFYATAWWVSFFPGLMIMFTVLTLNLVGEACEEAFDPKGVGGK